MLAPLLVKALEQAKKTPADASSVAPSGKVRMSDDFVEEMEKTQHKMCRLSQIDL